MSIISQRRLPVSTAHREYFRVISLRSKLHSQQQTRQRNNNASMSTTMQQRSGGNIVVLLHERVGTEPTQQQTDRRGQADFPRGITASRDEQGGRTV